MSVEIYPGFHADGGYGVIPPQTVAAHTGLELLQMMIAGKLPAPPISERLGFGLAEAQDKRVVFKGLPTEAYCNPLGGIHGGWTATIMDSALACCVMTTLAKGEGYTTVEFKINLIRPPTPGVEVFAEGKVISRGRTIAVSEGQLRDANGRVLAHGTETCAVFPLEKLFRS
jgi:uncharacterized protein (TIGR00369 family)